MVEVQGVEQPSYWNDMQSPVGTGEACPPGKYPYNGECLTEQEYIAASKAEMQKEQEDFDAKSLARRTALFKDINDIRAERYEEEQRNFDKHNVDYIETFDKSKKSDKIEPWDKIPSYNFTPEDEAEYKENYFIHTHYFLLFRF